MEYVVLWTAMACAVPAAAAAPAAAPAPGHVSCSSQPAQQSYALLLTNQHALQTSFLDAFFPVGKSAFSKFDW